MKERFLTLCPGSLELFEKIIDSGSVLKLDDELEEVLFESIRLRCDGFLFEGMIAVIPNEVVEAYNEINTDSLIEMKRKQLWIKFILEDVVPAYYGLIPIEKFCLLCSRNSEPAIKPQEVMDIYHQVDDEKNPAS